MKKRLLDIVLSDDGKLELARKVVAAIEDGLTAETIRGPQSLTVADNMARMRAAELGVEVLGLVTTRETKSEGGVVINITEARFLSHPPSTLPPATRIEARVTKDEEDYPA